MSEIEENRRALLQWYTSTSLQYASFLLTLSVSVLAEISIYALVPHPIFWAAVAATALAGLLAYDSYTYSASLGKVVFDNLPPADLAGPNLLHKLNETYQEMAQEHMSGIRKYRRKWGTRLTIPIASGITFAFVLIVLFVVMT